MRIVIASVNYARPRHDPSHALLACSSFPMESRCGAYQARVMQGLHDGDSFLLASVVGSRRDQWKRVVEMSYVGFLAPEQRTQAGNAVPGPKRSHCHLGLAQNSTFDDFTVMSCIFLDFMTRGPQQFALPENNFVLPPPSDGSGCAPRALSWDLT